MGHTGPWRPNDCAGLRSKRRARGSGHQGRDQSSLRSHSEAEVRPKRRHCGPSGTASSSRARRRAATPTMAVKVGRPAPGVPVVRCAAWRSSPLPRAAGPQPLARQRCARPGGYGWDVRRSGCRSLRYSRRSRHGPSRRRARRRPGNHARHGPGLGQTDAAIFGVGEAAVTPAGPPPITTFSCVRCLSGAA